MKISIYTRAPRQERQSFVCNDSDILFILMQEFSPHLCLWTYRKFKLVSLKSLLIGAGLAGLATAYYLCTEHNKRSITLIDPRQPMSFTSACRRNILIMVDAARWRPVRLVRSAPLGLPAPPGLTTPTDSAWPDTPIPN